MPDGDFHFDELVEFLGVAEVVGGDVLVSVYDEAVARKCLQTQDLLIWVSFTVPAAPPVPTVTDSGNVK